jgi:hypothetical protein
MGGSDRSHREKSQQEVVHRAIMDREIADLVDKLSMHNEITKRDFPMVKGQWGPWKGQQWIGSILHCESGYCEFRGQGVHTLRNREPRKSNVINLTLKTSLKKRD